MIWPRHFWRTAILAVFICGSITTSMWAQDSLTVRSISVTGNARTKQDIVERELEFKVGSKILLDDLANVLLRNEKRLTSTGIFVFADINISTWDDENKAINVSVALKEQWYLYPAPIFELADRNFNVWWKEQNCSFDRVNYGLRIDHLNLTGRKDKAKLILQTGYTKKYEVEYKMPYVFGRGFGFTTSAFYTTNKEIGYQLSENKVLFYKAADERVVAKRSRIAAALTWRQNAFVFHQFSVQYNYNTIDDAVALLNPDYFLNGKTKQSFFELYYLYIKEKSVFPIYPLGGYRLEFEIKKTGMDFADAYNFMTCRASLSKHFNLGDEFYVNTGLESSISLLRNKPAYVNAVNLGQGSKYVRGFELYVVNGMDYYLFQSQLKKRILNRVINFKKMVPIKQLRLMPIQLFLRFSYDAGYINEPNAIPINSLSNQWLSGFGPGIDMLLFNNFSLSASYNFNSIGEKGLYFNTEFNF